MQTRARQTRATIVAAAGRVFGQAGYAVAAMNDISKEAGTTSGALYFHFDSKQTLAQAVLSEYDSEMRVFCDTVLSRAGSPLRNMLYASFAWGHKIATDPIIAGGVRLSLERSDLHIRPVEAWDPWVETAFTLLTRARERGEISVLIEPASATGFLLAGFAGTQIISREYEQHTDLEDRLGELWRYSLVGILPRESDNNALDLIDDVRREVQTEQSPQPRGGRTA